VGYRMPAIGLPQRTASLRRHNATGHAVPMDGISLDAGYLRSPSRSISALYVSAFVRFR